MDWNDCRANQAPSLMRILDIGAQHPPETRHAVINQNTGTDVVLGWGRPRGRVKLPHHHLHRRRTH